MRSVLLASVAALAAALALSRPVAAQEAAAPSPPPVPGHQAASASDTLSSSAEWRTAAAEMRAAAAELRETVILAQNERGRLDATVRLAQATPSATIVPPAVPAPPPTPAVPSSQSPSAPALTPNATAIEAVAPAAATPQVTRKPGPVRQLVAATGDGLVALGTALGHAGDTRLVQRIPRVRKVSPPAAAAPPSQAAITPSAQSEASTGLFRR